MKDKVEVELIDEAKEKFAAGDYIAAKKLLSKTIGINPESYESYFLLGNISHIKGQIGRAIKCFKKVLEIDPGHTDASISLSVLYNDIGKYEEGKKVFDDANKRVQSNTSNGRVEDRHINRSFSEKHYNLAESYMNYNRFDDALREYNRAIQLDSENLQSRLKIAKVYSKKGFKSKSFEELRKLKTDYPAYMPARISLGVLYFGEGKVLEAQNEWSRVLDKDSENSEAKMYLNLSKKADVVTVSNADS